MVCECACHDPHTLIVLMPPLSLSLSQLGSAVNAVIVGPA